MIKIKDLRFTYGAGAFDLAVERLSIETGQRVALIGPSGSGKTTLLNLIAGILKPGNGRVLVDQNEVSRMNEKQRRDFRISNVGLVFQEFELLPYLSALDNVLLPFRIHSALKLTDEVHQRAIQLAAQLEIADKMGRFPDRLSQGERQRVAIARALVTQPKLLLADEPTGNLDVANKQRIVDLMLQQAVDREVTFLMVTHDQGLLDRFEKTYDIQDFLSPAVDDKPSANGQEQETRST